MRFSVTGFVLNARSASKRKIDGSPRIKNRCQALGFYMKIESGIQYPE